jgi:2-dehydro-3-deoxygluconokinase
MIAFVSRGGSSDYRAVPAGAESNVAAGMTRLGLATRWVSRLGDDQLGDSIERFLHSEGVDVAVIRDPHHPTGTMVRHVDTTGTSSTYYRSGSAASFLSTNDLTEVGSARWLHLTGITPALSTSAADLVRHLLGGEHLADRVSFDVNLRPSLWPSPETAADTLVRLASQADLVFIGDDEAQALLGTSDPMAVAEALALDGDREIVLKQGARGASLLARTGTTHVPGLAAPVVDSTGAGDAFAAGYLTGHCWGWEAVDRLRLGNLLGSRVVGVLDDVTPRWNDSDVATLTPEWLASLWDTPNTS